MDGAIVTSVAAVAVRLPAVLRKSRPLRPHGGAAQRPATARLLHPEAALLAVTGLIFLNQVLFTVYVLRVHDGDPSFVARHLPSGWFEFADSSRALRWLSPAGRLGAAALAGTVAACAAALPLTGRYYEAAMFAAAMAFVLTALAVCAVTDRTDASPGPSTLPGYPGVRSRVAGTTRARQR